MIHHTKENGHGIRGIQDKCRVRSALSSVKGFKGKQERYPRNRNIEKMQDKIKKSPDIRTDIDAS